MKLSLLSVADGVVRVGNEGTITSADFTASGPHPFEQVVGQDWGRNKVLLDMHKTSFIDSSAIGWLINCHRSFKGQGGQLILHSIPPGVRQVLNLLKIGQVLALADNEKSAMDIAHGTAASAAPTAATTTTGGGAR